MNPFYQNTYNNTLINKFNSHVNQPKQNPFMNNPMVANNPNFSLKDPNFYNKIHMAKIEQIKRAQKISDLGMDNKQLCEYIIDPIKINKTSAAEINEKLHDTEVQYIIQHSKGQKYEDQSNAYLRELWKNRTNQPYKNIIKKEVFDKDYKKYYNDSIFKKDINNRDELLVHKVIKNIDADEELLEAEFLLIQEIQEIHNKELKSIYSVSNENKYKREFEYAQKYRYRLEYNPKDSEELKDFYKKEQKKINKENKMLDQIIDMIVEKEDLSTEEVELLNKQLKEVKNKKNTEYNLDKELRDELGDDYDEIMNAIEITESKPKIKSKITSKTNSKTSSTELNTKIPRKKISVKTTIITPETEAEAETEVDNDLKEFYKNRKKEIIN